MKVQILSDLHLEGGSRYSFLFPFKPVGDVVVLAGDITNAVHPSVVESVFGNCGVPVLYVLGNHEYYRGEWPGTLDKFKIYMESAPNIKIMNNDSAVIDGVQFFGSTYWSDPLLQDEHAISTMINDFRGIIQNFSVKKMRDAHFYSKFCLKGAMAAARSNPDIRKSVVITHFAPSLKAQHPRYGVSPLTTYFCNDEDEFVAMEKPDLWIYGHTHDNLHFSIEDVPVVCNQLGYRGEQTGHSFDPNFVVEI